MAAAKKAASYGKRVILFDFVKPRYLNKQSLHLVGLCNYPNNEHSTQGSTWGLGGTCVNVG